MNRNSFAILLALLVIMSGVQVNAGTQAAFSDVTNINNNTFATGSVDIELASNAADCDAGASYSDIVTATLASSGIKPGDVVTASVCIRNASTTLDTRWALSTTALTDSTSTNTALRSQTKIRAWTLDSSASTGSVGCINGFNAAGADATLTGGSQAGYANEVLPSQLLSSAPSIAASASTQITKTATNHQKLCISMVLPSSVNDTDPAAATTIQGKVITFTMTIDGQSI